VLERLRRWDPHALWQALRSSSVARRRAVGVRASVQARGMPSRENVNQ
jgi:hypothetical protein